MEFALVDGQRQAATPRCAGTCPLCGNRTISKCGTRILWHWAHHGRKHCDPWWENETEWHRSWKACFAIDWREQAQFDGKGEKHVADVKTPSGTVLEFQNSAMPPEELRARERFYGDMIWIVNGSPFFEQFFILGRMPPQKTTWAEDIVFLGSTFWRKSENPDPRPGGLLLLHSVDKIQKTIDNDYIGHHLFHWVRPRTVWFESRVPVYLDFGGDLLWQVQRYYEPGLSCVKAIRKRDLIVRHGGQYIETGTIVRSLKRPTRNGGFLDHGEFDILPDLIR